MKPPEVEEGKYIIITADSRTGIILNNDGSYYQNEGADYYQIGDGKTEAIELIYEKLKESTDFEYMLYNHKGQFLEMFR